MKTNRVCRKQMMKLLNAVMFILIGILLLFILQNILTPNWRGSSEIYSAPADTLQEFYSFDDTDIQVIFLGTSHAVESVDPMRLYEETNVAAFNLATDAQSLETSYYLCQEAFRTQSPQFIFLEIGKLVGLKQSQSFWDPSYRYVLDNTPLNSNKIEFARVYAENFSDSERKGAFISAFFPIYSYHDRWNELTEDDFSIFNQRNLYRKGYYLTARIIPSGAMDTARMNETAEMNHTSAGWSHIIENGCESDVEDKSLLYNPEVDTKGLSNVLRIKELCEENGAELILFKVPSMYPPQEPDGGLHEPGSGWTEIRSNIVKALTKKYGLKYLDLYYDVDLNIDWNRDTIDLGRHLNYLGGKKVTDYFADYLVNDLGLQGRMNKIYEEDIPIYDKICWVAELQTTENLKSYLNMLLNQKSISVFLSVYDDMTTSLSEEDRQALADFGFRTDFRYMEYSDSFLAVKDGLEIVYEASSNRRLEKNGELSNGSFYTITSSGWLTGVESQIILNGTDYSMSRRGINIVVLDNESGLALDSVVFDTWNAENQAGVRDNSLIEVCMREYEEYLMVEE